MLRRVRLPAFAFVVTFVVPACARERIELAAGITAAEMRFELIDNRIFLEARINGQRPYQVIFDTGGQKVLDPATARELGLALRDESSQIGAGAQAQQSWRTDVALAEIGPVRLRDHEFMVLDLATIRHAIGFRRLDGLVGRELFERFIVDIDFEGLKLRFIEPSGWTPSPAHGRRVPLAFVGGGIPSIDATIDGVRGELAIDTGDRSSLTLFSPFVARERLREKYARRISAVTGWVPVQRIWLDTAENRDTPKTGFSGEPPGAPEGVRRVLLTLYRDMTGRRGMSPEAAVRSLSATDPFQNYPALVASLPGADGATEGSSK